ncbi:MAG: hypothetical protein ACWA6X_00690 [Bauldia sp.]
MSDEEIAVWRELIRMAERRFDGHLTILKFTTNWRVGFTTPSDRDDYSEMAVGVTFLEAARKALAAQGKVQNA